MPKPLSEADRDAYWRPLGQLLVERGFLTADELQAALDEQERTGGLLGEILMRNGLLSRLSLASNLHEQALSLEPESGFGSGLRRAPGSGEPQVPGGADGEPETEGGFGSGLRDALARHDEEC
jgi:hypothetical protein